MRLIDADALRETIYNEASRDAEAYTEQIVTPYQISFEYYDIEEYIDNAPTIDAVEVVRCKECRYFKKIVERSDSGLCYRDLVASARKENGYCSRGERKGGDTE